MLRLLEQHVPQADVTLWPSATDPRKGPMWRDAGLKDGLFEVHDATGHQMAAWLLALHREAEGTPATIPREPAAGLGKTLMQARAANL